MGNRKTVIIVMWLIHAELIKDALRHLFRRYGIPLIERRNPSVSKKDEESLYVADPRYLEECTYLVIVEMLERLPRLKIRIRKYLETFPE